jgi:hypothetical protein
MRQYGGHNDSSGLTSRRSMFYATIHDGKAIRDERESDRILRQLKEGRGG